MQCLAQIGRHKRAHDAEDRGEDEAFRLAIAGNEELGNQSRNETDDDGLCAAFRNNKNKRRN